MGTPSKVLKGCEATLPGSIMDRTMSLGSTVPMSIMKLLGRFIKSSAKSSGISIEFPRAGPVGILMPVRGGRECDQVDI